MLSSLFRRWAADANAAADAMERLAAKPKVTIELRAAGSDQADAIRRGQLGDLLTELDRRYTRKG